MNTYSTENGWQSFGFGSCYFGLNNITLFWSEQSYKSVIHFRIRDFPLVGSDPDSFSIRTQFILTLGSDPGCLRVGSVTVTNQSGAGSELY